MYSWQCHAAHRNPQLSSISILWFIFVGGNSSCTLFALNETFVKHPCITHDHDSNDKVRRRSKFIPSTPLTSWWIKLCTRYSPMMMTTWNFVQLHEKLRFINSSFSQNHYYSSSYPLSHSPFLWRSNCPLNKLRKQRRRRRRISGTKKLMKQFSGILYLFKCHLPKPICTKQIVFNSHVAINGAYLFIVGIKWINSLA